MRSPKSPAYTDIAIPNCFKLFKQETRLPCSLALLNAGSSSAAKIAMTAMTTSSSISVKAPLLCRDKVQRIFSRARDLNLGMIHSLPTAVSTR
jgi:transcription initiation factor TFIID subunit TAF12